MNDLTVRQPTSDATEWTIDKASFLGWIAKAERGASIVYRQGERPGVIGAVAAERYDRGEIVIKQRRIPCGFAYIAERVNRAPQRQTLSPTQAVRTIDAMGHALLTLIKRAANLDLPCPPDAQLAADLGLRNADAARYEMKRLIDRGFIAVDQTSPTAQRVVHVVGTELSTRMVKR